jgi:hypothetical protein
VDEKTKDKVIVMYEIFISMVESAFLHYSYHTNKVKMSFGTDGKNFSLIG